MYVLLPYDISFVFCILPWKGMGFVKCICFGPELLDDPIISCVISPGQNSPMSLSAWYPQRVRVGVGIPHLPGGHSLHCQLRFSFPLEDSFSLHHGIWAWLVRDSTATDLSCWRVSSGDLHLQWRLTERTSLFQSQPFEVTVCWFLLFWDPQTSLDLTIICLLNYTHKTPQKYAFTLTHHVSHPFSRLQRKSSISQAMLFNRHKVSAWNTKANLLDFSRFLGLQLSLGERSKDCYMRILQEATAARERDESAFQLPAFDNSEANSVFSYDWTSSWFWTPNMQN